MKTPESSISNILLRLFYEFGMKADTNQRCDQGLISYIHTYILVSSKSKVNKQPPHSVSKEGKLSFK